MAVTTITVGKIPLNGGVAIPAAVACGADGAVIPMTMADQKLMLIIGTADATIKAGNGIQGVDDLVIPFTTGSEKAVVIESGKYVNTSGENKGKILITGTTATIQAVELP